MGSATVATRARLHTRLQNSKFQWLSRFRKTVVPPVMTSASGVDGVRAGKPPGARGGIQILGMVRGEWLRLPSRAYGRGAGCWVIAGTWSPPGVSLAPRSLSVCSCSPGSLPLWSSVRSRLPLQSSWLLKEAFSTSLLLCVSLRLLLQATSGACSASSWLRFSSGVGRAGGLASPSPFVGAEKAVGLFASVRQFWGRCGRGLGIPRPDAGCRICCRHVRACSAVLGPSGSGAWHPRPIAGCLPRGRGQSMSDPQLRSFLVFGIRASALAHVGQLPLGRCGCISWVQPSLPLWPFSVEVGPVLPLNSLHVGSRMDRHACFLNHPYHTTHPPHPPPHHPTHPPHTPPTPPHHPTTPPPHTPTHPHTPHTDGRVPTVAMLMLDTLLTCLSLL